MSKQTSPQRNMTSSKPTNWGNHIENAWVGTNWDQPRPQCILLLELGLRRKISCNGKSNFAKSDSVLNCDKE